MGKMTDDSPHGCQRSHNKESYGANDWLAPVVRQLPSPILSPYNICKTCIPQLQSLHEHQTLELDTLYTMTKETTIYFGKIWVLGQYPLLLLSCVRCKILQKPHKKLCSRLRTIACAQISYCHSTNRWVAPEEQRHNCDSDCIIKRALQQFPARYKT